MGLSPSLLVALIHLLSVTVGQHVQAGRLRANGKLLHPIIQSETSRHRRRRRRYPHSSTAGNQVENEQNSGHTTKHVTHHATRPFQTLQCNIDANLSKDPCTQTWTSLFGSGVHHKSQVVVPCGQCITMDYAASKLTLSGGLDIQGKLVFPDEYRLTLEAPYIRVQGELHMNSTKIPNEKEDVKFVLTGTDSQVTAFRPADSNADVCGGELCATGKKPIVVAGGKVVIEALTPDTPTWLNLYDVYGTRHIVLSDVVKDKWGIGSEILITSSTLNYDDEQVRTIASIRDYAENGYVIIELDSSIERPTTLKDDTNYAVEVALLSRNIVFEGAKDDAENPRHGAHFIVIHTPDVEQKIEGVEFRNFGQQGKLGRYPIHFHLCGEVKGSIISKNLVRESNQRCIVLHGSHYATVEANIAYDTAGHCFVTEDGFEHHNVFRGNLGSLTHNVVDLIPDGGKNGEETDDMASTFWMTSPSNIWVGNVAAGSEHSGFWLETRPAVRGPKAHQFEEMNPKKRPLSLFESNVAHSNMGVGIRTYPKGYIPDERAVFLNSRSYRNQGAGFFTHNSNNLAIIGGNFADNRKQLDLDRAANIVVNSTAIVGFSSSYRSLRKSLPSAPSVCHLDWPLVGIQLHTFVPDMDLDGASINNVSFSGFLDTGCSRSVAFNFDEKIERGSFDYFTRVSNITFEEGMTPIDFCDAEKVGVTDAYIIDTDSSLQPPPANFDGTSTLLSDKPWMTTFIPASNCTSLPDTCYTYCENTCLRTVTYGIDIAGTENYKLKVCDKMDNCIEMTEKFYYHLKETTDDTWLRNTQAGRRRYFAATLPRGSYTARFLDAEANEVWPTFVEETYEDALCSDALKKGSVKVIEPSLLPGECDSLIRNGNAEATTNLTYWLHHFSGVTIERGKGREGSNAFADLVETNEKRGGIAQWLDTRCLRAMKGKTYEIQAWVNLRDYHTGDSYICNAAHEKCPKVQIVAYSKTGTWSREWARMRIPTNETDYQLVHGQFVVPEEVANATSVLFLLQRNRVEFRMFADDISLKLVKTSTVD